MSVTYWIPWVWLALLAMAFRVPGGIGMGIAVTVFCWGSILWLVFV